MCCLNPCEPKFWSTDQQGCRQLCRLAAATSLLHLPRSARKALPYMHPGRVDVIGAGALIWRTIVRRVAEATEPRSFFGRPLNGMFKRLRRKG